MALSTQKGRSFYAFKLQISIFGVIRGHVDESNIQGREQNSEREMENIVISFFFFLSTGRPDFKGSWRKSCSNFDMTALLM
jgi:hypothetical protein